MGLEGLEIAAYGNLEVRQFGGARQLVGSFPYGQLATRADRGRVRKETFAPRAFEFAIDTEPTRKIDLLVGHDFGKPVASRQAGSLAISDSESAVTFTATLPDDPPTWVLDMEKSIRAGTMTGVSPGFRVPPLSKVPRAEELIPEPGNPAVSIRVVRAAVLREMSVVTNSMYEGAVVELRSEFFDLQPNAVLMLPRAETLWL